MKFEKKEVKKKSKFIYQFMAIMLAALMMLNSTAVSAKSKVLPQVSLQPKTQNVDKKQTQKKPTSQGSYWDDNEWLSSVDWENLPGSVEYLEGIGDYDATSLGQRSAVKIDQIANGQLGGLGLDANGKVWSWGYNLYGELGIGVLTTGSNGQMYFGGMRRMPFFIDNNINVIQIQGNYENRMALDDNGKVYTWGHGAYGEMGDGTTTNANPTPKAVAGLPKIAKILSSNGEIMGTNYAIDEDGNLWGWGYNANGQLGIGSTKTAQTTPVQITKDGSKFVKFAAGDNQLHAIDENGDVWNAGYQYQGRLGNGKNVGNNPTLTKMSKPSGMGKIVDISSSYGITIALDESNQVWQWGPVFGRAASTGTPVAITAPEKLEIDASEITKVGYTPIPQSVFAGESISYFIDQHGRPWAWGSNRYFGLGREGGYEDANDIQLKSAQQWPKVLGDGDSQIYDSSKKTPFSGLSASGRGGYGFNDLHPTIYDEKYKDSKKDKVWQELALRNVPKVSQIVAGRSTYTMLDDNGNIYKWGNDGSGSVAWGWDYDPKYDQNGSKKDGLYDRYLYEVMFMRGMPLMEPMQTTVEKSTKKIYIDPEHPQVDKIKVKTEMPANFNDPDLNLSYTHELQSVKYIIVPYDTSNEDFNKQDLSEDEFNKLYDSKKYESGNVLDSPIKSEDKAKTVVNEIEIKQNCKVFVMSESKGYSQNPAFLTSYVADNFYTPTTISHVGNGYVDGNISEQIYKPTQENIAKVKAEGDDQEKYGVPLDVKGEVIKDPSFGYDKVSIQKYATLPNGQDKYWIFTTPQDEKVDLTLNDKKYVDKEHPYSHEFKYERNPSGWATITYRGVDANTNQVLPQFSMTPMSEVVKVDQELTRTPPAISNYDILGYNVNTDKTIYNLDSSGNMVFTPKGDSLITFLYGTWVSNANKTVVDDNGDGFASSGEGLSYQLSYTNDGAGTFKGAQFKDTLENVLPYVQDTSKVSVVVNNNGEITTKSIEDLMKGFTLDVAPKTTVTVSFKLYVKDDDSIAEGTVIKNSALIGDVTKDATIEKKDPAFEVSKTAQDATNDMIASPGEKIHYTIHAENKGEATGSNVVIKDTLEKLLIAIEDPKDNVVTVKINGTATGSYTVKDLMNGITIEKLAPKETVDVEFDVTVKTTLDVKTVTQLENSASVGKGTGVVTVPTGKAKVEVSKTSTDANHDGVATPGEVLTYVLRAENKDTMSALNVGFKDDLAMLKEYLDESEKVDVVLDVNGNKTVYTLDDLMKGNIVVDELKPNQVATVTFAVRLRTDIDTSKVTKLKNIAIINGDDTTNEVDTGKANIVGDKKVSDENGDHYASPKETLTYTITLTNTGDADAINPVVKDELTTLLPCIDDPTKNEVIVNVDGESSTYTVADLMKGIQIAKLNKGKTATVTFKVVVKADFDATQHPKLENIATVNDTPLDPGVIDAGKPELVTKKQVEDANKDGYASSNEVLTYTITTENKGLAMASKVFVQDALTNVLPYIKDPKNVSVQVDYDGTLTTKSIDELIKGFTIDKIEASKILKITFKVEVKDNLDLSAPVSIENSVIVGDSDDKTIIPGGDPNIANKGKTASDENGDGVVTSGEKVTYTIYAENEGPADATNLIIKDDLKDILKAVDNPLDNTVVVDLNGVKTNYKVSDLIAGINIPTLKSKEKVTVTFVVQAKADLDTSKVTQLHNLATIGDSNVETTIPTGTPELVSSKVAKDANNDGYASSGEVLTYTITSENKGKIAIDKFVIKDDLKDVLPYVDDPKTNVVKVTYNGTESTTTVEQLMKGYMIDRFAPNDKVSLTFDVKVKADLDIKDGSKIKNSALVGDTNVDNEVPLQDPKIESSKVATDANKDGKASPGEVLTYTLHAENKGDANYSNFLVKDDLQELLPYIDSPDASEVIVDNAGVKSVYTIANLKDGIVIDVLKAKTALNVTFNVTVKKDLNVKDIVQLKNTAILGDGGVDEVIDTGKAKYDVKKVVSDQDGDNIAVAGETLTYTVVAKNIGDATGSNFVVKDDLASVLPYVNDPKNSAVTATVDGKTLTYKVEDLINGITVDSLEANKEMTFTFKVNVKTDIDASKVTSIKNTVMVDDSSASAEIPTGKADVATSKTATDANGDGKASPNEVLTYILEAKNNGNASVHDFVVKDDLAGVLPYVNDPKANKVVVDVDGTKKEYTVDDLIKGITIPELNVNGKISVSFEVTVKADLDTSKVTTIKNVAVLGGEDTDNEFPTGKADIQGSKTASDANKDGMASPGEELTYVIEATNKGTAAYTDFVIKDELKDLTAYIEDADANDVTVNVSGEVKTYKVSDLKKGIVIPTLKPQESVSATFKVVVKKDLDTTKVDKLRNTATLGDEDVDNEFPTGKADIQGSKTASDANKDGMASPGEELTYVIEATNKGTAAYTDFVIKDELKDLTPYIENADANEVAVNINGEVKAYKVSDLKKGIVIPELKAQESVSATFKVVVKKDLDTTKVDKLRNTATLGDEDVDNEFPTGNATITSKKIVKDSDGDGIASAGEKLNYVIVAENTGDAESKQIAIKDELKQVLPLIQETKENIVVTLTSSLDPTNPKTYSGKDLVEGIAYKLQAKERVEVSFTVTLQTTLETNKNTAITNTAKVGDDDVTVTIPTGSSDLKLTKTVADANNDNLVEPGEDLSYTIHVENTGKSVAHDVVIQDTLEYMKDIIDSSNSTSVSVNVDGVITNYTIEDLIKGITIDKLESGKTAEVSFKVHVKDDLDVTKVKEVKNVAVVAGTDTQVIIPTGSANIVGKKEVFDASGDGIAAPNEELTYVLTAENTGSAEGKNVEMKDELEGVLKFITQDKKDIQVQVTSTSDASKNKTYTAEDLIKGLTFDIAPTEKVSATFKVTLLSTLNASSQTEISNTAKIGGGDNTVVIETGNSKIESDKRVVDENGDGVASPSETMTYTITAKNTGDVASDPIEIKDSMALIEPMITESLDNIAVNITSNQDATKNTTVSARDLANGLSYVLQPNEELTLNFSVVVKADLDVKKFPSFSNTAIVGPNKPSVDVPTGKSEIVSTKTVSDADHNGIASPSEALTYTITADNKGSVDEKDIVMQDTLDQELSCIKENPKDIVVTIKSDKDAGKNTTVSAEELIKGLTYTLLAGEEVTITFTVTLKDELDVDAVKEIKNIANIGGRTPEVDIVTGEAEITGSKTVKDANGDGYASPHEELTYTLNATNEGSVLAQGVKVQDTLENVLPYIEDKTTDRVVHISSDKDKTKNKDVTLQDIVNGLTFDIDGKETITVTIDVTLADFDVTAIPKISNTATIGDQNPSVDVETKDATFITSKKVKDANGDGVASFGEQLTYTISATNVTSVDAKEVLIQDTLVNVLPYIKETADNINVSVVDKNDASKNQEYKATDLINGMKLDIDANDTLEIQFIVTVLDNLDTNKVDKISNVATVGDTSPSIDIEVEKGVYEVMYDANGYLAPNIPSDAKKYKLKDQLTVLGYETNVADNQKFISWNTAPDGSGITLQPGDVATIESLLNTTSKAYISNQGVRIDGVVTLYAIWQEDSLPPIVNPPLTPTKPTPPHTGDTTSMLYMLLAGLTLSMLYAQRKFKPFTSSRRKRLSK